MPAKPRFSVLIPTYNYGRFVGRAIDSALSQPGDDFEVIVLDDGSSDDTPQVMQAYAGRVRCHRHDNCGAAATRNRGVELARGEWLLFLDADDCLLPEAISHFRHALTDHPESRMVFGHHVSISQSGNCREAKPQPQLGEPLNNFRDYLDRKFGIAHGTVLFHRDVFQTLRYPEGITNGEDIVLFAQTLAVFPCSTFPHATAAICAHENRMRNNIAAIIETGLQTVSALFQPEVLPADAMRYRRLFTARRSLSLARSLFKAERFQEARQCYLLALRADWKRALTVTNFGRFLQCLYQSLRVPSRRMKTAADAVPRLLQN